MREGYISQKKMLEDARWKLLHDGEKKGAVAVIGVAERWGAGVMHHCHLHPRVWLSASTTQGTLVHSLQVAQLASGSSLSLWCWLSGKPSCTDILHSSSGLSPLLGWLQLRALAVTCPGYFYKMCLLWEFSFLGKSACLVLQLDLTNKSYHIYVSRDSWKDTNKSENSVNKVQGLLRKEQNEEDWKYKVSTEFQRWLYGHGHGTNVLPA